MNSNYNIKTECRCCKSKNLNEVLDLGEHPLANSYHFGTNDLARYPLKLNVCTDCFHCQLSIVVNPDEMFKHYSYQSGIPKTFNKYCEWFSEYVEDNISKIGSVLDIACNDGTQLEKFKKRGWRTFGIDPATNLKEKSKQHAEQIIDDYFNIDSIDKLSIKQFDAITAQNVFAHLDDVDQFLQDCKIIMTDNSRLYIQTSQANMIDDRQFDTIYHEHLSYFSVRSMKTLCERNNLLLLDVSINPIHGESYIFVIGKTGKINQSVNSMIDVESKNGRYLIETYKIYAKAVYAIIENANAIINQYMKNGYLIVGYGAAAKANTFLNFSKIKPHFIIDDTPTKQEKLTPGTNCMIMNRKFIEKLTNNVLFITLAWNFHDELKSNIEESLSYTKFAKRFSYKIMRYYPDIEVSSLNIRSNPNSEVLHHPV